MMIVTYIVFAAIGLALLAIPLIITGIVLLAMLFSEKIKNRRKLTFVISFALICFGELMLFPAGAVAALPLFSNYLSMVASAICTIISVAALIVGSVWLITCIRKRINKQSITKKSLVSSTVTFLISFGASAFFVTQTAINIFMILSNL